MGGGPRDEENPAHEVALPGFQLARAPVQRAQYQAFLDATGHEAPPFWHEPAFEHPRAPAVGPSWIDAMAFCRWYGSVVGEAAGLPSEAQWEAAAKAGRDVIYPWGDGGAEAVPDYARRWLEGPEPVDAFPSRHPWGFLGLGENVHEWCCDWYGRDYYRDSPRDDPRGSRDRPSSVLPWRLVAARHQDHPLRRALVDPARPPLPRLRLPDRQGVMDITP